MFWSKATVAFEDAGARSKYFFFLFFFGMSVCVVDVAHAEEPVVTGSEQTGAEVTVVSDAQAAPPMTSAVPAAAQTSAPEKGALEMVLGDGHMSNDYGNANSFAIRGVTMISAGVLQGELVRQSRFGFNGEYGGLSFTRDFSPDWYATVGAGAGSSELFPSWRIDATGYRKLGSEKQYVVGFGGYFAKGKDSGRSDSGVLLTSIVYFSPLVLEAGVRVNRANPGAVTGPSQYIAATIGSDETRAYILRADHAKEAYQVFTSGSERVNYDSQTYGAQWRERISRDVLLLAGLQYYRNPLYSKTSLEAGLRWSFR